MHIDRFKFLLPLLLWGGVRCVEASYPTNHIDLFTEAKDRTRVGTVVGTPSADKRVWMTLAGYEETPTRHTLYLPKNWVAAKKYPVFVEYLGNGGTVTTNPTHATMGQTICNRMDFITLALPFVAANKMEDSNFQDANGWGDLPMTVAYAKAAIRDVCENWGGDATKLILMGHSRGAIACNYVGLYDDEIAGMWRGMIPVSHYGAWYHGSKGHLVTWNIPEGVDVANMQRLGRTPQLIMEEYHDTSDSPNWIRNRSAASIDALHTTHGITTMDVAIPQMKLVPGYIKESVDFIHLNGAPNRRISYLPLPYLRHSPDYFEYDFPGRDEVTAWLTRVTNDVPSAEFTASISEGVVPMAVTFTDISLGLATTLQWSFGDGQSTNTAAGAIITHTYTTAGTYTASLTASGAAGTNTVSTPIRACSAHGHSPMFSTNGFTK